MQPPSRQLNRLTSFFHQTIVRVTFYSSRRRGQSCGWHRDRAFAGRTRCACIPHGAA
ncbi:hypothetical protein F8B43_4256 [Methylorubrum populi]|uniref:Uncharacterized protein n=1 Tax=Methylorubrum populi TaxID=223967 RepID=A0A833J1X0_9HYPH|nr:hypothetical protein F8B43_4256 [Methylorubrum populi]